MSIAQSQTPGDKSLTPDTTKTTTHTVEDKYYTLSTNFYDIGDYLEKLKIQQHQNIFVTIKGGSYKWEKPYKMAFNSKLTLRGEGFQNGGKNNKVSFLIGQKDTFVSGNNQYAKNARLIISNGCIARIEGINIFEKINDNRKITPDSLSIGIFNVCNAQFYLMQGMIECTSSPIINVAGQSIATIIFGHTFFERNPMSFNTEIKVVDTQSGWGFSGNKAIVSRSHTHLGNGCVLQPSKKIEVLE